MDSLTFALVLLVTAATGAAMGLTRSPLPLVIGTAAMVLLMWSSQ